MAPPPELFDMRLRALRRDRAARCGPVLFLHERAFSDILERLAEVKRGFSSALLVGTPDSEWPRRLGQCAHKVVAIDPGPLFARAAGGSAVAENELDLEPGSFDLAVAVGTLDTVNDLPGALLRLRFLLKPDSLLIGAIPGGETLPRLRQAVRSADALAGVAAPHVHPRIEPAALAQLLASVGLTMPVVDVDRIEVAYNGLRDLVCDLRGMAATNVLKARPRSPFSRAALAQAEQAFKGEGESRVTERFELLHFAAWTPSERGAASDR